MRDIEELVLDAQERIDTNNGLKKEKKETLETFLAVCRKNKETFFDKDISLLCDMHTKLRFAADKRISKVSDDFRVFNGEYGRGTVSFRFNKNSASFNDFSCLARMAGNGDEFVLDYLNRHFATEDAAIKSANEVKALFASVFEEYIVELDGQNQGLVDTLQKLKSYLNDSSSVEHKEDGTVEFHINGKVYIGTVKEEKNA